MAHATAVLTGILDSTRVAVRARSDRFEHHAADACDAAGHVAWPAGGAGSRIAFALCGVIAAFGGGAWLAVVTRSIWNRHPRPAVGRRFTHPARGVPARRKAIARAPALPVNQASAGLQTQLTDAARACARLARQGGVAAGRTVGPANVLAASQRADIERARLTVVTDGASRRAASGGADPVG